MLASRLQAPDSVLLPERLVSSRGAIDYRVIMRNPAQTRH